jgi:hypothetical protein
VSGNPQGWVRKKKIPFEHTEGTKDWCHRPNEEHVLEYRNRSHVGDVWVCPECKTVWVAVLRPSLLDAAPHWSVKWKRMWEWRAKGWRQKWEQQQ